jgi:RHS repeat-associated protein
VTANSGITTTLYTYDPDGQRARKRVVTGAMSVTTEYIGNWMEVTTAVTATTSTVTTTYVYLGSQRVAMRIRQAGQDDVTYTLHPDHLGSTSAWVGSGGEGSQTFYAYGLLRDRTGPAPTDVGFTGQHQDSYIKLAEMGARWYDLDLGRFAQPDSIIPRPDNSQSLNRYTYAYNNPVRFTDPSGHDGVDAVRDFLNGILLQWSYTNVMTQQARQALVAEMAKAQDPTAMTLGRHVGNGLAIWQAIAEADVAVATIAGGGIGGAATCLETFGAGCMAGVVVMGGGAAVATHGAVVGLTAAGEEGKLLGDVVSQMTTKGTPKQPAMEEHHLLPRQFKERFERAGLDIEEYKVKVPAEFHKDIHGRGGGDFWESSWNPTWEQFFEDNPTPTQDQILVQLHEMAEEFDIQ